MTIFYLNLLIFSCNFISTSYSQQFNQFGQPGMQSGPYPNSNSRFANNYNPYEPIIVPLTTSKGPILGHKVHLFDAPGHDDEVGKPEFPPPRLQVVVFWGIPYAEPPIGDRRFRPPEPKQPWQATLNCTQIPPMCPQFMGQRPTAFVSEDCLYLNVFTPNLTYVGREFFPVLVFIHGGGFQSGAGHSFPGHILASSQGVVVVTFNYRLGALGFLSTGDEISPGNYGILDQLMAITWVKDNIHFFKGNPNKITIFGHEAGGISAGLLTISPKGKDLFQAVIAQSGSDVARWGVVENIETSWNTSKRYGDRLGCSTESSRKLVNCLMSRTHQELANTIIEPEIGLYPFTPVVDITYSNPRYFLDKKSQFLSKRPEWLLEENAYIKLPYICGFTCDEGTKIILKDSALGLKYFEMTQEDFESKIFQYIRIWNLTISQKEVFAAIKYMYTHWPDPTNKTWIRQEYINMLSDAYFKSPCDSSLKLRSKGSLNNGLYMYMFNYTVETIKQTIWQGVPHGSDLPLVFGIPFLDRKYLTTPEFANLVWTRSDRNMSEMLMKMWSNFANYGNPTPVRVYNATWLPVSQDNMNYLVFNSSNTTLYYQNYEQTRLAFWRYYLPIVTNFGFTTPYTYWMDEYEKPYYIALWSVVSVAIIFLIVIIVLCCFVARRRDDDDDKEEYSMD